MAKSGGESISLKEFEKGDRERSQELQPEEKGTDGRFSILLFMYFIAIPIKYINRRNSVWQDLFIVGDRK